MKVLFFIDRLRLGGIQSLALDILRHVDVQEICIDILTLDDGTVYPLSQTLREMNVTVYQLKGIWFRSPLDFPRYFRAVDAFFDEHHDYDVVHVHSSSKNYYVLQSAQKHGIPVRVAHSHNTGFQTHNPLSILLGNAFKPLMKRYANRWVGCSHEASEWLFGTKATREGRAQVVLNGINPSAFMYDCEVRSEVRQELGLEGKFVIGHVGRFENQKNHTFLLDIFAEVCQRRDDAVLVLVGIGSLMEAMRQKAETLGIADKVMFLGFRDDRNRIMQAMDAFLFPSLYEGLSVVLIEVQAAGLPVLVSDSTTPDTAFTPTIQFMSLSRTASEWAEALLALSTTMTEEQRIANSRMILNSDFEITQMIENLKSIWKKGQLEQLRR